MTSKVTTYSEKVIQVLKGLPGKPGVYQFLDKDQKILYVGKAKNLKKRVNTYFTPEKTKTGKLAILVRKTEDIKLIVVRTEYDALLLENNLIKKHQPRYNVLLRDDKTYPWICIKNEPFPRIFPTRNLVRDGSQYFGPYASGRMMHTMLELIRELFPVRNCHLNLTEKFIRQKKYKICLEYHIGNCKGPCEGLQTEDEYNHNIHDIREIIRGNISTVLAGLKKRMKDYAIALEFEKAQAVKEKTVLLEKYQSKSTVVNPAIKNADVFSFIDDKEAGYVNYMKVLKGAIVQSHTIELRKKLDETPSELLSLAITDFRQRFESDAKEIIIPFDTDIKFPGCTMTIPKIGDKKELLALSERNTRAYMAEKSRLQEMADPERFTRKFMQQVMADLRMPEPPVHIECFDNSNLQGTNPVAAMVCFMNGKPAKNEYRHYNIKTVEGPDDYASMKEIIGRRYRRLLEEEKPIPQLVIIDGGKGQLNAALEVIEELGLKQKITLIGIAKRLEEIYFPGDSLPIYLDKRSSTLKLIQQLRDEAHRFGITHHRLKRTKSMTRSELTGIEGIGENTAQQLLRKFKSVKNIKSASLEQLTEVVGKARAKGVYEYFLNNH